MTQRQKRLRYEANDYYAILNLPVNASAAEVKKHYRQLALQWHPDKHQGGGREKATAIFQQVAEAHEVLAAEDSKREYDEVWQRVHANKPRNIPEFARNVGRSRSQGPERSEAQNQAPPAARRGGSVEPRGRVPEARPGSFCPPSRDAFYRPPSPEERDRMPRAEPPRAARVSAVHLKKQFKQQQQQREQQAKEQADRDKHLRQQEAAKKAREEAERKADKERRRQQREEDENNAGWTHTPHMSGMGQPKNEDWKNQSSWQQFAQNCQDRTKKEQDAQREARREAERRQREGTPAANTQEHKTPQQAEKESREKWDNWCTDMAKKHGWGPDSWQDNLVHLGRYTDDGNRAFIAQKLMKGEKPPRDWKPQAKANDSKSTPSKASTAAGAKAAEPKVAPKEAPTAAAPKAAEPKVAPKAAPRLEKNSSQSSSNFSLATLSFNPQPRRSDPATKDASATAAAAAEAMSKAASQVATAVSDSFSAGLKMFTKPMTAVTKPMASPFTAYHRQQQMDKTKNSRCPHCGWVVPVDNANYCGNCETRFNSSE